MDNFYALMIHLGKITIDDVPNERKEKVKAAYKKLYGEDL